MEIEKNKFLWHHYEVTSIARNYKGLDFGNPELKYFNFKSLDNRSINKVKFNKCYLKKYIWNPSQEARLFGLMKKRTRLVSVCSAETVQSTN